MRSVGVAYMVKLQTMNGKKNEKIKWTKNKNTRLKPGVHQKSKLGL